MYEEDLGRHTAEHLSTHIKAYLDDIWEEYDPGKSVPLIVPKRIDFSSVVGGMISEYDQILPQYGIDVLGVVPSVDDYSLWTHEYAGQINAMVHAGSREAADYLIARHGRAIQHFIRQHRLMHQFTTDNFKIVEFVFAGVDFSGAEDISGDQTSWLAAASINVSWFLSEDGPDDHGN